MTSNRRRQSDREAAHTHLRVLEAGILGDWRRQKATDDHAQRMAIQKMIDLGLDNWRKFADLLIIWDMEEMIERSE